MPSVLIGADGRPLISGFRSATTWRPDQAFAGYLPSPIAALGQAPELGVGRTYGAGVDVFAASVIFKHVLDVVSPVETTVLRRRLGPSGRPDPAMRPTATALVALLAEFGDARRSGKTTGPSGGDRISEHGGKRCVGSILRRAHETDDGRRPAKST